eukprot:UC4_evm11s969
MEPPSQLDSGHEQKCLTTILSGFWRSLVGKNEDPTFTSSSVCLDIPSKRPRLDIRSCSWACTCKHKATTTDAIKSGIVELGGAIMNYTGDNMEAWALRNPAVEESGTFAVLGRKKIGKKQVLEWCLFLVQELAPILGNNYPVAPNDDIPALELLKFDDHLRQRVWIAGPVNKIPCGYPTLSDVLCYLAIAAMPIPDEIWTRLPHICRWFHCVRRLPVLQQICTSDLDLDRIPPKSFIARGKHIENDPFTLVVRDSSEAHASLRNVNIPSVLERIGKCHFDDATTLVSESKLQLSSASQPVALGPELWKALHCELDPAAGDLDPSRSKRKRWQVENLLAHLSTMNLEGKTIVEFGSGGGHLGLVVAACFPSSRVLLLDRKKHSLARARRRARNLGLKNIQIIFNDAFNFREKFDIGIALHFCGLLTDLALQCCVEVGAAYVLCPCCYGKIGADCVVRADGKETKVDLFPRPRAGDSTGMSDVECHALASCCDFGPAAHYGNYNFSDPKYKQAKECMGMIDTDRNSWAAKFAGYNTHLYSLVPLDASPKNNIIVGIPPSSEPCLDLPNNHRAGQGSRSPANPEQQVLHR